MNHDDSPRHRTQDNYTTRGIAASTQWHDAELAMKMARYSFDSWLTAGDEDTRVEAAALVTTPARGTDIPTPRR